MCVHNRPRAPGFLHAFEFTPAPLELFLTRELRSRPCAPPPAFSLGPALRRGLPRDPSLRSPSLSSASADSARPWGPLTPPGLSRNLQKEEERASEGRFKIRRECSAACGP